MQSIVNRRSPALEAAIGTVRSAIAGTPSNVLASLYREVAQTTHDSCNNADIRSHWAEVISIMDMSSSDEIAESFKSWVERAIETADPRTVKDFLANVLQGVITASKRAQ